MEGHQSGYGQTHRFADREGAAYSGRCPNCHWHQLCLSLGLDEITIGHIDQVIRHRIRVSQGACLLHMDDSFNSVYVVRYGYFKLVQFGSHGEEQIFRFQMAGDLVGLDGIGTGRHTCDTISLKHSEVCGIPFTQFESLLVRESSLRRRFHELLSNELVQEKKSVISLRCLRSEQRFAAFLIELCSHYETEGNSPVKIDMPMKRSDIGNYLGLTNETISRLFSGFKAQGFISVQGRQLHILDLNKLKEMVRLDELPILSKHGKNALNAKLQLVIDSDHGNS